MLVNVSPPLPGNSTYGPLTRQEAAPDDTYRHRLAVMALDVKSRSKRYEKLDFLGEGQVGRARNISQRWFLSAYLFTFRSYGFKSANEH